MHVIVYCPEGPDSGLVHYNRELDDNEPLNLRKFADLVARECDAEIAEPSGHIPNCCGDIRVEFMDHVPCVIDERFQGATRIWSGESYYFVREGE